MNTDAERLARVALSQLVEPGDPRLAALIADFGAVDLVARLRERTDLGNGILDDMAARLQRSRPEQDLEKAATRGIRYLIPGDPDWPAQLGDLAAAPLLQERGGPPVGLWVKGPLPLADLARSVAIVGSRSSTSYGDTIAADLAAALAQEGYVVVSGAAFGIDYAAHRGALAAEGPTVAVLACGLDRHYPMAHRQLLEHLGTTSAVVSELAPGCAPLRMRFLSRNRVIAALSQGTIVVEAAARSGALNTANWATRLNRQLMGVPGSITSAPSQGVHQLIRNGAATLITHADEVLELLGQAGERLAVEPRGPTTPRDGLTVRQRQILDAVPVRTPVSEASIARTSGVAVKEVRDALAVMVGRGLVRGTEVGWRLAGSAQD